MRDAEPWWSRIHWIQWIDALLVIVAVFVLLALTADYWPRLVGWIRAMAR